MIGHEWGLQTVIAARTSSYRVCSVFALNRLILPFKFPNVSFPPYRACVIYLLLKHVKFATVFQMFQCNN